MCDVHCFDFNLFNEWLQSSSEYSPWLLKPCSKIRLREMWACSQDKLVDRFRAWCILLLYVQIVVQVLIVLVFVADGGIPMAVSMHSATARGISGFSFSFADYALMNAMLSVFLSAIFAWVMWFGIPRQPGCCWCVCCCFVGKFGVFWADFWLFLWALGEMSAVVQLLSAFGRTHHFPYFIACVLHSVLAIVYSYLTVTCFQLGIKHPSSVGPPVQMQGPTGRPVVMGQVVGGNV